MLIFFVEKIAFDTHHIMHKEAGGDVHNHGNTASSSSSSSNSNNINKNAVSSASGRSATILLVALGVHALMETMALGLSSTKLSAGLLATSIGLHQVRRNFPKECQCYCGHDPWMVCWVLLS